MNIPEAFSAKLEAASTFSQTPRAAATALAVLLLVAQYENGADRQHLENREYRNAQSGTHQVTVETEISATALWSAIVALHTALSSQQIELDGDTKAAIYHNLWDLYE